MEKIAIAALVAVVVAQASVFGEPKKPSQDTIARLTLVSKVDFRSLSISEVADWARDKAKTSPPFYSQLNVIYFGYAELSQRITSKYHDTSLLAILQATAQATDTQISIAKDAIYLFPKSEIHFFTTQSGRTYANVVGLRPTGAVCNPRAQTRMIDGWVDLPLTSPVTRITKDNSIVPYGDLPKVLRDRYTYDDPNLALYIKAGVDGDYSYREDVLVYAGVTIQLKQGKFVLNYFTDAPDSTNTSSSFRGGYSIRGHWLILDNAKLTIREWIMVVIDNRLALIRPDDYLKWKDVGILEKSELLYQRIPKKPD